MERREPSRTAFIDEDHYLRVRHNDSTVGIDTFEPVCTHNGILVPHPGRYHIFKKEPEDFMCEDNQLRYFGDIAKFVEQRDRHRGTHPNPPAYGTYMSANELARYEEHRRVRHSQRARYYNQKAEAWKNWLVSLGVGYKTEILANGYPRVVPESDIRKDPAFSEMESWEVHLEKGDEQDWTASKALRGQTRKR